MDATMAMKENSIMNRPNMLVVESSTEMRTIGKWMIMNSCMYLSGYPVQQ